jgi:RNA polymerase sigma-70 factor (ECF subfamily)
VWLYRIAHNLVVDYFRTHRLVVSLEGLSISDGNTDDVDDLAFRHLNAEMVKEAIRNLTDEQQQVIVLKFLEGYETEEIAEFMKKERGAVHALQHRALVALQKMVSK